jgi:hypothetical protein
MSPIISPDVAGLEIMYGNFEEGIVKSRKAYELDSNNIILTVNLGTQYYCHKNYKESLKYYKK